jgi:site-specific DNA-cytosine methylase
MLSTCFPTGIDIIIAGPPCQPYSSASLKKGF